MQEKGFEGDTLLAQEIQRLISEFKIKTVIETGTEYGATSNAFSQMVQHVVTIDTHQKWTSLSYNVDFLLGDSRDMLLRAIRKASPPILFYLDAHTQDFSAPCPLREELEIIAKCTWKPVLVIHDAQVPDHPELGYATYAGTPISLEHIRDLLPLIYPHGFNHHFNTEATGAQRGVLFVTANTSQSRIHTAPHAHPSPSAASIAPQKSRSP